MSDEHANILGTDFSNKFSATSDKDFLEKKICDKRDNIQQRESNRLSKSA